MMFAQPTIFYLIWGQIRFQDEEDCLDVINDPCVCGASSFMCKGRRNLTSSGKCWKKRIIISYSNAAVFITYCSLAEIKAQVLKEHFSHEISLWKYFKHVQCNLLDLCRMFRYLGTLPGLKIKHVVIGHELSGRFSEILLVYTHVLTFTYTPHYPQAMSSSPWGKAVMTWATG